MRRRLLSSLHLHAVARIPSVGCGTADAGGPLRRRSDVRACCALEERVFALPLSINGYLTDSLSRRLRAQATHFSKQELQAPHALRSLGLEAKCRIANVP